LSVIAIPNWFTEHASTGAVLIRLVTPVDHYLMSERSAKYGLLFVIWVSCVLFVFEILTDIRIHPVQYAMVAAALCLFFLLLVSLSEVIGFSGGYLIAATMTTALLAFYVAAIAKSPKRGAVLAGLLGAVYGYLFLTLVSEDHALLLGSLLLFVALGLTMIATRRLDWYTLGEHLPGSKSAAARRP
jgi:inner membrane protein